MAMTLRDAQIALRRLSMESGFLAWVASGRLPTDALDALRDPYRAYLASRHPNTARRMVDMATLAALATVRGSMDNARPVLEKALAYGDTHPTPPDRLGRYVRHYAMAAWIRFLLMPADPDAQKAAVQTSTGLFSPQEPDTDDLHTCVDLATLNQLLSVLALGAQAGPEAVRPLAPHILQESAMYRFADMALGTSVPWLLLAAAFEPKERGTSLA